MSYDSFLNRCSQNRDFCWMNNIWFRTVGYLFWSGSWWQQRAVIKNNKQSSTKCCTYFYNVMVSLTFSIPNVIKFMHCKKCHFSIGPIRSEVRSFTHFPLSARSTAIGLKHHVVGGVSVWKSSFISLSSFYLPLSAHISSSIWSVNHLEPCWAC